MNILTFDIEEWYIEKKFGGDRSIKYLEFNNLLEKILDLLDKTNQKGTFFCLGKMASDFPDIVKLINSKGHEIGCHSNEHYWLNKMTRDEIYCDTKIAINELEQCIGKKIVSYRAPAFSIGENNKWAFEILADCGIINDSSIFPAVRDFGGYSSFPYNEPTKILSQDFQINEFPIQTMRFLGKKIVYSGGGYFRLFPLKFIKKQIIKSNYSMSYFHLNDLIKEQNKFLTKSEYENYFKENGNFINRIKRYTKSNIGTSDAFNKLSELIQSASFISLNNANNLIDWEKAPAFKIFY